MSHWIRFKNKHTKLFGLLSEDIVTVYEGDMFDNPRATNEKLKISDVELINTCAPS